MQDDITVKKSFLYEGVLYEGQLYISDVTWTASKDVTFTTISYDGLVVDQSVLGSYAATSSTENGVVDITLNEANTLTIECTTNSFSIENFVVPYNWTLPAYTGTGYRTSSDNTFKSLVSTSPDLTIEQDLNGDLVLGMPGQVDSVNSLSDATQITLSVIRFSDAFGFFRVSEESEWEVDTYKKLPINYTTDTQNCAVLPGGSFTLAPGKYYVDAIVQVRVGRRSKLALFSDVDDSIILHGTGNYGAYATISVKTCTLRGFVDVTIDSPLSLRIMGYDLGTYFSPGEDPEEPIVVHSVNFFKVAAYPAPTQSLLIDTDFSLIRSYVDMTSNTTTPQVASSSSIVTSTYPAWKAFSAGVASVNTDAWLSSSAATEANPQWVQIEFTDGPRDADVFVLQNRPGTDAASGSPIDFTISARNTNEEDWTTLIQVVDNPTTSAGAIHRHTLPQTVSYSQFRLTITKRFGTSNHSGVARFSITANNVGKCATSDPQSDPYITVNSDVDALRSSPDCWVTSVGRTDVPEWLEYDLKEFAVVRGISLRGRSSAGTATSVTVNSTLSLDFSLQAWDSVASSWVDLFISPDVSVETILGKKYYWFENTAAYKRYRIYYQPLDVSNQTHGARQVGGVQLFGNYVV